MCFNSISINKIIAKITEFTVSFIQADQTINGFNMLNVNNFRLNAKNYLNVSTKGK